MCSYIDNKILIFYALFILHVFDDKKNRFSFK